METFHIILIGFHRFTSLHPFIGLQMIFPLYIYPIYIEREREAGSYKNANYLRECNELFRCTKSYMIHIQKSIFKNHVQKHI